MLAADVRKRKSILLSLLLVVALVTGCTVPEGLSDVSILKDLLNNDNGDANGSSINPYSQQGVNKVLALKKFSLNPERVLEGEKSTLTAVIVNKGEKEVDLYLGQRGRSLLKNYCRDLFSLERYESTLKSQMRGFKEVTGETVVLKPFREIGGQLGP